jgi:ubiquinone/menaquinone biosynthesis C-methylase UbiE
MNALDWDHNAYYHRLVLRHLPRPCNRVLDVGCGAGAFAVELAKRAEHVDALDRSPAMIEEAKRVAPPNVTCILADVLQEPLPDARYDAIVSISALHHTLPRYRRYADTQAAAAGHGGDRAGGIGIIERAAA